MKCIKIWKVFAATSLLVVLIFPVSCSTSGSLREASTDELNDNQRVVRFVNFSPQVKADMIVIDPEGRRVGYDLDEQSVVNQIPGASFSGRTEFGQVSIVDPVPGAYTLTITGNGDGEFYTEISYDGGSEVDKHYFQGGVNDGTILSAVVMLDPEAEPAIEFSLIEYN